MQLVTHGGAAAMGGTARARIARQGAQRGANAVRSRSPSTSPVRQPKSPPTSPSKAIPTPIRPPAPAAPETYISRTDSVESITSSENSALLKDEEKNHSQNSLCIYFDTNDVQDTCV